MIFAVKYLELGASVPVREDGVPLSVLSWDEFVNVASSQSLNLNARNTASLLLELGQAYSSSMCIPANVVILASASHKGAATKQVPVGHDLSQQLCTVVRSRGMTAQISDVNEMDTERRANVLNAAMHAQCIVLVLDDSLASDGLSNSMIPAILSRQHVHDGSPSILVVVPEGSRIARDACVDLESMVHENVMVMAYDKELKPPCAHNAGRSRASDAEIHRQLAALQHHAAAIAQEVEMLVATTRTNAGDVQSQPETNSCWITFDVVGI